MYVNEYQLAVVAEIVATVVDPGFSERTEQEQQLHVQQTSAWLLPLLQALPEGVSSETLNEHSEFIFACAEDFLLEAYKNNNGYRTMDEQVLRSHLDSEKIQLVAVNLYRCARVALEHLPQEVTLEMMVDNFGAIDLDAEMLKLVEELGL